MIYSVKVPLNEAVN